MMVYVGVCGCMGGVVQCGKPMLVYVGVCGCTRCVVQCGEPYDGVCVRMWVYAWCGSVW